MDLIQNKNCSTRRLHPSVNIYYDAGNTKKKMLKELRHQVQTACEQCGCFKPQFQQQALSVIERPATELRALEILSGEQEENPSFACPVTSDDGYQQLVRELELRVIQRARYIFRKYFSSQDPEGDSCLQNGEARLKSWEDNSQSARLLKERLLQASKFEPSKKPCLTARYSPEGGIFALATDSYYQKNLTSSLFNFGWSSKLTVFATLDDLFFAGVSKHSVTIANFMEDQYNLTYAMPESNVKRDVVPFVDKTSKKKWGVINGDKVLTYKLGKADCVNDLTMISIKDPYYLVDKNFTESFGCGAFISVNNGPRLMALGEKVVRLYQSNADLKQWTAVNGVNDSNVYNISTANIGLIRAMQPDSLKSGHLICGGKSISIIDLENYTSYLDNDTYVLGRTIIQHIATDGNVILASDQATVGLIDRSQKRSVWDITKQCIGLGLQKEAMILGFRDEVSCYDIRNLKEPVSTFSWKNLPDLEFTHMTVAKDAILLSYGKEENSDLIRLMCEEPKVESA